MSRLAGKTAFITGAGGGIGRALVRLFRAEGVRVAASDLVAPQQEAELLLALDVTNEAEWADAVNQARSAFGRLDILVNNAGLAQVADLEELSLAAWRKVTAVNLDGTFLGVQAGIRAMRDNRDPPGGAIVNLASIAGLVAAPPLPAYSAAKGGVIALTRSAAIAVADKGYDIRINALCPGFTDTAMLEQIAAGLGESAAVKDKLTRRQPLGRLCTPEEIAEAALYLASDASRTMTGACLTLDGGYSAR